MPLYHGSIDLKRIAVSKKLSPSAENQYLYILVQHLYEIQVLNLCLICKASRTYIVIYYISYSDWYSAIAFGFR